MTTTANRSHRVVLWGLAGCIYRDNKAQVLADFDATMAHRFPDDIDAGSHNANFAYNSEPPTEPWE